MKKPKSPLPTQLPALPQEALVGVLARLDVAWSVEAPPEARLRALRESLRDLLAQHLVLFEAALPPAASDSGTSGLGYGARSDEDSPHGAVLQVLARLRRQEYTLHSEPEGAQSFVPDAETAGAMVLSQFTAQFGPALQHMFTSQAQLHALRAVQAAKDAGLDDLAESLAGRIREAAAPS